MSVCQNTILWFSRLTLTFASAVAHRKLVWLCSQSAHSLCFGFTFIHHSVHTLCSYHFQCPLFYFIPSLINFLFVRSMSLFSSHPPLTVLLQGLKPLIEKQDQSKVLPQIHTPAKAHSTLRIIFSFTTATSFSLPHSFFLSSSTYCPWWFLCFFCLHTRPRKYFVKWAQTLYSLNVVSENETVSHSLLFLHIVYAS